MPDNPQHYYDHQILIDLVGTGGYIYQKLVDSDDFRVITFRKVV